MQITIDTKKDSKEEISQAIAFLKSLIQAEQPTTTEFPEGDNVFGSMFDAPLAPAEDKKEETEEKEFSLEKLQTY